MTGTIEGSPVRESLKTRSWERAEQLKTAREANLTPIEKKPAITLAHALQKYYERAELRKLAKKTLSKYETLKKTMTEFAEKNRITKLSDFNQERVTQFLTDRKLSAITLGKEIERVRTFFTFCQQNDWLEKNPAKYIKPPKSTDLPRLPFSDDEVNKMIAAAEDDREMAFILVLRHSALRIGDAALLRTTHFNENRIILRTTKSGSTVSVVIPPQLVSLLKALPTPGGYFFLRGESTHPHSTSDGWRKRIKVICKDLQISPDHPHRFRHTLAKDLLQKGASVEDVAAVLGNSPAVVVKHYSQWVASRQTRLDEIVSSTWQTKLKRVK